ncbi:MAG: hypothetical protein ACRELA_16765 [Candidatus Rokuibacteriota bacterium]
MANALTPTQELLDLWRKGLEEGTQAWLRAMGQGGAPQAPLGLPPAAFDFTQLWRPLLSQGMEVWQKAAAQGALTPEFMQQWKNFMNQWIETWSKTLEQAMGTDAFAQALGRQLDQWMAVQAPLRKGLEQQSDAALRTLGLPSRGQVVSLASQVVALEERIEGIEDRLAELKTLLKDVLRAVTEHEEAAQRRAASPGEGP